MKLLFVSLQIKKGFEKTDVYFANFLKDKLNFKFCVLHQQYYKKNGFYSYSDKILKKNKFKKLNTKIIYYKEELYLEILKHDLIIFSPIHGSEQFVKFAKKFNKKVISIDSGFNYDFNPNNQSDLIVLKGENSKKVFQKHQQNYIKNKNIRIVSCLQSEFLKEKYLLKKNKFLKKYNIKKKIITFLPTGPQHHDKEFLQKYIKICKFFIKKDFHVMIKLHPTEYNKNKIKKDHANNYRSDFFFKNLKNISICDQEDFYSAIKYSDFVTSTHTTAYVEVNLMHKPMIFIDRLDFFGIKNKNFYKKRNKINFYKLIDNKIINNKKIQNMDKEKNFNYFGCDVEFNYIIKFLQKKNIKINKILYERLLKNNNLYCKNYMDNSYSKLEKLILNFMNNNKVVESNNNLLNKLYLNFIIFLKKILTK